ncbi:MAG: sulfotransferase family protein [Gemmata sp.]
MPPTAAVAEHPSAPGSAGPTRLGPPPSPAPTPKKREWAPRIWEGTDVFTWMRLLKDNGFAVQPGYWYIAGIVSVNSVMNTCLRWVLNGWHGQRIRDTALQKPPVFVIGHWRTGTTMLHELLIRDPRFGYPDMQDCFNPQSALLTHGFFKRYCSWMLPDKRPMDNMPFGWERPQEDEFALALLGVPSTYTDFAFPARPPKDRGALDLSGLTPAQLTKWKRVFVRFLKEVTVRTGKPLVLKSPPHTARVPLLMSLFPDAKFVHIVRDPRVVFPSTLNLWKSMARRHGLQTPTDFAGYEEKVLREFSVIYDRLEEARPLFKSGHFAELRYEDLVRNPVGELRKVYDALGFDGFDEFARPRIVEYEKQTKDYETNKYQLTPEQRALVEERWGDVIRRYGY